MNDRMSDGMSDGMSDRMSTDLHYKPEAENRLGFTLSMIFLSLAVVFFFLSGTTLLYAAVWHSLVLIAAAAGIYFLFRYHLSYRTYHLQYMNGRAVLIVTDTQGRRISTACHLYLDEITHCDYTGTGGKPKVRGQMTRVKRFFYSNTLSPARVITLDAVTEIGCVRLILASNEVFYRILAERIELAKAQKERVGSET